MAALRGRQRGVWLVWLALTCGPGGALGQSLQVSSRPTTAGEWVTPEITFQPGSEHEVVALQWEMEIAAGQMDRESAPVARVSVTAKEAGKSVNCARLRKNGDSLVLSCLLAGSQTPVPGGVIALVSLKTNDRAHPGEERIRLQHAIAVSRDLKQLPVEAGEAVLTIRAR